MTLRYRLPPFERGQSLKFALQAKQHLRIIEVHNGLSAIVANTATADVDGTTLCFDGLWVSSLTDSAAKGHPDTEVIDASSRIQTILEIAQVSNKPIIVDGDTGGDATNFEYFCTKLEQIGVSAVIIEDKKYPKRNSLESASTHLLEDPKVFAHKINRGKAVCLSDHFMIFARIESFIAGMGYEDALMRASIYLDSAADGILIHSSAHNADEVLAFAAGYKTLCQEKKISKPLVCVPTKYAQVTDTTLFDHGFNMVIYANHLLRAAHAAMVSTCQSILTHQASYEASKTISPVQHILKDVGYLDVKQKDASQESNSTPVILLAAGAPKHFNHTPMQDVPISNIPIADTPLHQWQTAALKQAHYKNIQIVTGFGHALVSSQDAQIIHNTEYDQHNFLHSLLCTQAHWDQGFVFIFGDIFFDKALIQNTQQQVSADIALVVDSTVNLKLRKNIKPTTDLVCLQQDNISNYRSLYASTNLIADIGNHIPLEQATHEFTGIAYFSAHGARLLRDTFNAKHEEPPIDFFSLLRTLIQNQHHIQAIPVQQGWSEIHTMSDIVALERHLNYRSHKHITTA